MGRYSITWLYGYMLRWLVHGWCIMMYGWYMADMINSMVYMLWDIHGYNSLHLLASLFGTAIVGILLVPTGAQAVESAKANAAPRSSCGAGPGLGGTTGRRAPGCPNIFKQTVLWHTKPSLSKGYTHYLIAIHHYPLARVSKYDNHHVATSH